MTSLNLSNTFQHLRRDALAGTVAGAMAVPLTAGICLMSDYPIMTGMYTVIFACIEASSFGTWARDFGRVCAPCFDH